MKEKLSINQLPDLKQAVLDLSEKEKNKLLIRLINKDQLLIEQLHYRLLEDEFDLIKRYEDLKQEIENSLVQNKALIPSARINTRANLYLSMLRNLSGKISHFSKVTKSSFYELELRIFLLIKSSEMFQSIQNEDSVFGYKARNYQITKIKIILKLFDKLHEDLRYDFLLSYSKELELYVFRSLNAEISSVKLNIDDLKSL